MFFHLSIVSLDIFGILGRNRVGVILLVKQCQLCVLSEHVVKRQENTD